MKNCVVCDKVFETPGIQCKPCRNKGTEWKKPEIHYNRRELPGGMVAVAMLAAHGLRGKE